MSDETAPYRTPTGARETARDDETFALPKEQVAPPKIEGYTIRGRLGEGGMGAVFLAQDDVLGRSVAIKVISNAGNDSLAEARFLREARSMATAEHPNIVRVISFGTVDRKPYLIMELVDGESLSQRLLRVKRMSVNDALRLVRPVVEALAASWQKGIVHRDIKPSNILIDKKGTVRVADFGLAKSASGGADELTQTGLMVGSPFYIAPEQASGLPTDFRADIYALGIVLYEMLTGERPFTGVNAVSIVAKHLHAPLPPVRAKRADVPPLVEQMIERMTMKDPAMRYASYGLLLRDIDRVLRGETAAVIASKPARRNWAMWVVLAVVITLAALALTHRKTAPAPVAATPAKESGTSVTVTSTPPPPPEPTATFATDTIRYPVIVTQTQPQPIVMPQTQQPVMPEFGPSPSQQQQQQPPPPRYPPPPPPGAPPPMGGPPPPRP